VIMRGSSMVFAALGFGAGLLAALLAHGAFSAGADDGRLSQEAALVSALGLSDLALFTEARFTRHPSQADLFSAFQDAPMAFEHFPTGSLISPPRDFGPAGGFAAPAAGEGSR